MVVGEGFEPSKSMTADLQSAPFGRSGTPPGVIQIVGKAWRWWWGKDYSSLRSSPFGPLPLATFSRFRSSRTLIEGSHPSPISANICIAHRGNYIAVVNNGGGGRIIRRFAPHPSGRCLRQRCLAFARLEPWSKVLTLPSECKLPHGSLG